MARKRGSDELNKDESYVLLKVIKQAEDLRDMKMAPRNSPFANLCGMISDRGLFVFDTDGLEPGRLDLLFHVLIDTEGLGMEWIVSPDGDDAIILLETVGEIWLFSLAMSRLVAKIPSSGPFQVVDGLIHVSDGKIYDYTGAKLSLSRERKGEVIPARVELKLNEKFYKILGKITCTTREGNLILVGLQNGQVCLIDNEFQVTFLALQGRKSPILYISILPNSNILIVESPGTLWLYKKNSLATTIDR